jgi:hypothetical protein
MRGFIANGENEEIEEKLRAYSIIMRALYEIPR